MDASEKIGQLQQMAAADPRDELTYFLLGSELLHAGRFDEAAAALEHSLDLKPAQAAAARLLGDAYRHANQTEKAIAAYRKAVAISETTGDLQVAKEARVFLKRLSADSAESSGA